MKQKYIILKNEDQNEFIFREYAELDDREILLMLGEEKYGVDDIKSVLQYGKKALISKLRTEKLFPPTIYADQIAESVFTMFRENKQSAELLFDDIELLTKEKKTEPIKVIEKDSSESEIDELLEDDLNELDDNLVEKDSLIIDDDDEPFDID